MTALDAAALRGELGRLCERHRVPGAQLAVRRTDSTVAVEYGVRSLDGGAPVTSATAFPAGSVTKAFTAALALVLVEDGDLAVDEPLTEDIPEFGAGKRVTLRHLLTHTAGLASAVSEPDPGGGYTRARWVRENTGEGDLVHPPGTVFSYSNAGYVVAGALVEAVTGMDWREAVGAILLDPLGITPSFVTGPPARSGREIAAGHTVRHGRDRTVVVPEQTLHAVEDPDGGLNASAADLVAFAGLFTDGGGAGGPLGRAMRAAMCRDQLDGILSGPVGMADGWGLGLARYRDGRGRDIHGHDGSLDGVSCHLRVDPADGSAVALTTNANTGQQLWDELSGLLEAVGLPAGNGSGTAAIYAAAEAPPPPDCTGTYTNGPTVLTVERAPDGPLRLASEGRPAYALTCRVGDAFSLHDLEGEPPLFAGRFLRDADTGRTDGLLFSGRLARRVRQGDG
ncbi:serine hydrolase domain-containing protein [Streptomyces sp. NPDC048277]|uniref:serine hydrolase domain-containing protein n=1 Tax=Streptomyces sp. NPDC048277 TaxID=3155027 RepID=UPI0033DC90CE